MTVEDYKRALDVACAGEDYAKLTELRQAFVDGQIGKADQRWKLRLLYGYCVVYYSSGNISGGFNVSGKPQTGLRDMMLALLARDAGGLWIPVPIKGKAKR